MPDLADLYEMDALEWAEACLTMGFVAAARVAKLVFWWLP